ncbi:MAG: ATP-dependent Clp protease ATP-binding subunit [Chitinophagales bacterium]|nr:ATP-dependent Clp protease ATP-binding subunit [Chitinophagales bacterium]
MLTLFQYSADLKFAVQVAQAVARENNHAYYTPAHLLKGLLHNDIGLVHVLKDWGKDTNYLKEWADARISKTPKSARPTEAPPADENTGKLIEVADVIRLKLGEDLITPVCVLIALSRPNVGFTQEQLKSFPIEEKELLSATLESLNTAVEQVPDKRSSAGKGKEGSNKNESQKYLAKFCIDKTELAQEGKIDPIVGRDREIRQIAEILGRRTKPNVIIVGEPGVGKTALVEGFALSIIENTVAPHFQNSQLFELDLGALVAGAAYKGEVEERLKGILHELKSLDKAIVFIDEIHVLLDPRGSAAGAANLLKPELARGEITVIGATTFDEFRKYIELDDAFKRRFAVLEVSEPSHEAAERMLKAIVPLYETHHEISISPESLRSAIKLAARYLKGRQLPDAAIDLVDRTMAAVRLMNQSTAVELKILRNNLERIESTFASGDSEAYLRELRWFDNQIRDRINPILIGRLEHLRDTGRIEHPDVLLDYLNTQLLALEAFSANIKECVEASDIAAMVAHSVNIPVGKIQADEREKLEQLTEQLKKRVIGQDHAIETLGNAISIARAGLSDERRPIGSFFFLGPTGTGKTELAKSLAEFLFNDENALIRFDMSEYNESHSAATLIGAPAGFVGHEEGGLLVNRIRQQPYSVVLFDEIEKAHADVFKIFLQVLDDGRLTDKLGKVGDFSNAIILFTSNAGAEYIVETFNKGSIPDQGELIRAMSRFFKDEFLGRVTEVIPFAPIQEDNIIRILEVQLKRLRQTLNDKKISLEISPEALKALAMRGFSPRFGARPLRRVVFNDLQKPLARHIIGGKLDQGGVVNITLDEQGEFIWNIHSADQKNA